MATGNTTTDSLDNSLPSLIASARIVREQKGGMVGLVDVKHLGEGKGITWHEVSYAALIASAITQSTEEDNPQQLSDTDFSITPTMISVHTLITDKVARNLDKGAFAKTGGLGQNAIERKKDEDGLTVLDGASISLAGAGTTLTSGHIAAAVKRVSSNTTEPGLPPYRCVLHGFQIKDVQDEMVAGVGTYPVDSGLTAEVLRNGFQGMLFGAQIYENGNITIDSSTDDAKGGVFAKEAIVLVQGKAPWAEVKREAQIGGGSTSVFQRDEYAYGERSAGNWLYEIYSDASTPTS